MNLSTIKRATAIYRVNNLLFILKVFLISYTAQAQEMNSYCFGSSVNLKEVRQSISFLLLPKDIVDQRTKDNCLDIVTSPDRGKLFEKFLSRRYDQIADPGERNKAQVAECRLDLKTTKQIKVEANNFKLGGKTIFDNNTSSKNSVSIMEMLLGDGQQGELEAGSEQLKVVCRLTGNDRASLVFSYAEKNIANVNTEVQVKKGEWLNIASVIKDLADKRTTIGLPQTEISQGTAKSEIIYELLLK